MFRCFYLQPTVSPKGSGATAPGNARGSFCDLAKSMMLRTSGQRCLIDEDATRAKLPLYSGTTVSCRLGMTPQMCCRSITSLLLFATFWLQFLPISEAAEANVQQGDNVC